MLYSSPCFVFGCDGECSLASHFHFALCNVMCVQELLGFCLQGGLKMDKCWYVTRKLARQWKYEIVGGVLINPNL